MNKPTPIGCAHSRSDAPTIRPWHTGGADSVGSSCSNPDWIGEPLQAPGGDQTGVYMIYEAGMQNYVLLPGRLIQESTTAWGV